MAKALIIGSGGREHALGWSIAQDDEVEEVIYAPGNPGTAAEEKGRNINIDVTKDTPFKELADIVEKENVDMIVVGPEQPLVDSIVNVFNALRYDGIFGPTADAAQIEADKFYSSKVMQVAGIPQAESILCMTADEVAEAINKMSTDKGIVIKARGLTGGKGVYVCDSKEEALAKFPEHIRTFKSEEVQICERLFGQEFSVFGISDGERVVPLEMSVQDHKPLLDGDKGPNTGGMGAYGPAPVADAEMVRKVADTMMTPLVQQMKKEEKEFKGFLYAAVIMTEQGPKILEYNCRFGDPECQPSVMMLKNGLYKPIKAALEEKLDEVEFEFKPGAACCVVMASNGYPASYDKGLLIGGLEEVAEMPDVKVFHAGTGLDDQGRIITAGGRVLGVTALRKTIGAAQDAAYDAVAIIDKATTNLNNKIVFFNRKDIADKAINR